MGVPGPKGDTGIQGIQGARGPKGDKGEQGDIGLTGPIGQKGDKGDKGDKGNQGDPGESAFLFTVVAKINTVAELPSPMSLPRNYAYLVDSGTINSANDKIYDLYIITGESPNLIWTNIGPLNGVINTGKVIVNSSPNYVGTSTAILGLTSDNGVAVATDTGHWYYWDGSSYADGGVYQATQLGNASVTPLQTTFYKAGKNLFNKNDSTIINGKYLGWGNGYENANAAYFISEYIPIEYGKAYVANHNLYSYVYYNANKEIVKAFTTSYTKGDLFNQTGYSNVVYMRFSAEISQKSSIQIEQNTEVTAYEPYSLPAIDYTQVSRPDVTGDQIDENTITADKTTFAVLYNNLLNLSDIEKDYYWGTDKIKRSGTNSYIVNNPIKLKPNTTYYVSYDMFIKNFTWLATTDNKDGWTNITEFGYGSDNLYSFRTDATHVYLYVTLQVFPNEGLKIINAPLPDLVLLYGKSYTYLNRPIYVGPGKDFTKLKDAVKYAVQYPNSVVYVEPGTYDLVQEYGQDYLDGTSSDKGLELKNNIHIIFSSNSLVTFNYTGSNYWVHTEFSPFNSGAYGFTIENLSLECSNCRYCIHDERGNTIDRYVNKYINCKMSLDNRQNSDWNYNPMNIGGGLGSDGTIVIDSCMFNNTVSYHNNNGTQSDFKSHIIMKNSYIENHTFQVQSYGVSTKKTIAECCGNSFKQEPLVLGDGNNMVLYAWNNVIHK